MSKTQVIILKKNEELKRYFKKNLFEDEIIIGMGAGLISKWMRELKIFYELIQELVNKFGKNISIIQVYLTIVGLILEVLLNFFLNQKIKIN